jgi:hypothetical protein
MFSQNRLIQVDDYGGSIAMNDHFGEKPDWFTPKVVEVYEVWIFEDRGDGHFCIFIDVETGNLFLSDYHY